MAPTPAICSASTSTNRFGPSATAGGLFLTHGDNMPRSTRTYGVLDHEQAQMLARLEAELARWGWTWDPPSFTHRDYVTEAIFGSPLHFDRGTIRARVFPDGRDHVVAHIRLRRNRYNPSRWWVRVSEATVGAGYVNRDAWTADGIEHACRRLADKYGVYASLL